MPSRPVFDAAANREAHIGNAPERHSSHLPRAANPIGQIPRLDAAWRHSHRQPDASLIRYPIWRLRGPQSLDRTMRERNGAARQSRATSHFLHLFCSVPRNVVATELAALSEPARTQRNNKLLFCQHKMHAAGRRRIAVNRYTKAWGRPEFSESRRPAAGGRLALKFVSSSVEPFKFLIPTFGVCVEPRGGVPRQTVGLLR